MLRSIDVEDYWRFNGCECSGLLHGREGVEAVRERILLRKQIRCESEPKAWKRNKYTPRRPKNSLCSNQTACFQLLFINPATSLQHEGSCERFTLQRGYD